jgi:hypothetical protein
MMTVSDIGRRLGVSRQRAGVIVNQPGFPKPSKEVTKNRITYRLWHPRSVEAWVRKNRKEQS